MVLQACDGDVVSEVLSGANVSAYNSQAEPDKVAPSRGKVVVTHGVARSTLLPHSLSVFTLRRCHTK